VKLDRLDLIAYGPFTRESLDFAAKPCGLHFIYGPNEAGKSTALRALRALLFGIPSRTSDDFLHKGELRIGGCLQNGHGDPLDCVRRKGNKNTLRDGQDGDPLAAGVLEAMLGSIDEAAFKQRFAIDYEELVAGGEAIVEGRGDIGNILFSATAGLANLNSLQKEFEEKSRELFKPGGSKPKINLAITGYDTARKAVRAVQLSSQDWTEKDAALRQTKEREQMLNEEFNTKSVAKRRAESYKLARPELAKRQQLLAEAAELKDAPALPATFAERRLDFANDLIKAREALRQAEQGLLDKTKKLKQITVPVEFIEHAAEIAKIGKDFGAYDLNEKDIPKLTIEKDKAQRDAALIQQEFHDVDFAQLRVNRAERARLAELASEYKSLLQRQETASRASKKLQKEAERQHGIAEPSSSVDLEASQRLVLRWRAEATLQQRLEATQNECQSLARIAEQSRDRLGLKSFELDSLARLAPPSQETITRCEAAIAEQTQAVTLLAKDRVKLQRQLSDFEIEITAIQQEQAVPTEEDLATARATRERGWELIVARLDGRADAALEQAYCRELAGASDLSFAYRAAVDQADQIADRLRREAQQVAKLASFRIERLKTSEQLEQLKVREAETKSLLQAANDAWQSCCAPLTIEPQTPGELRGWLASFQELTQQIEALAARRREAEQLQMLGKQMRSELTAGLAALDAPPQTGDAALGDLLAMAEQMLKQREQSLQEFKQQAKDAKRLQKDLTDAAEELTAAEAKLAQWQQDWSAAMSPLGLAADVATTYANGLLAAGDEYVTKIKEAEDKARRMEGIQERMQKFDSELRKLAKVVLNAESKAEVPALVAQLQAGFEQAQEAQVNHRMLVQDCDKLQQEVQRCQGEVATLTEQLQSLRKEARCETIEELPAAEARSGRKAQVEAALHELNERLARMAGMLNFDEFLQQAAQADEVQLAGEIGTLTRELELLEQERRELGPRIGALQSELGSMNGNDRAAMEDEKAQDLLSQLRDDVAEYARLKLAGSVLRRAVERYRERHQGPVLEAASRWFSQLTLGSFASLRPDFDDKGNAILVGVRPDGKQVEVSGMSDGSCDQLYLAVRLAGLQEYLSSHPPIPFVVDDILINFDNARSSAALAAFAEISQQTQVIFFTHHEQLLELAAESLPADSFAVHCLASRNA
jgi:uncharacterized protein YhaN